MAYYYYPDNLYHAPNNSMNNANVLCGNIAAYQASADSILPFGGSGCTGGYYAGGSGAYGGYGGYGGFGNSFMNTSYEYSKDANGNITSNYSQHPDYISMGMGLVGGIANGLASAKIAGIQAKTNQQQQMFYNMAYQQQSSSMAKIQQQQMNQKTMQDTMGMMMNMMMMQKMMASLEEA